MSPRLLYLIFIWLSGWLVLCRSSLSARTEVTDRMLIFGELTCGRSSQSTPLCWLALLGVQVDAELFDGGIFPGATRMR
jgi:hypothetical protein